MVLRQFTFMEHQWKYLFSHSDSIISLKHNKFKLTIFTADIIWRTYQYGFNTGLHRSLHISKIRNPNFKIPIIDVGLKTVGLKSWQEPISDPILVFMAVTDEDCGIAHHQNLYLRGIGVQQIFVNLFHSSLAGLLISFNLSFHR